MPNSAYRIVLDIGTTTIKALVFNEQEEVIGKAVALPQKTRPQPGWVEQDPLELLDLAKRVIITAVRNACIQKTNIESLGITNQRETIIAWNKITGKPLYPAIVWEDARTAEQCSALQTHHKLIREKTGLPLIPYFSASKISWLLNQNEIAAALRVNELLVGTVDSWILWNITSEHSHATDSTNASRTLLFNTRTMSWDTELCRIFSVPLTILPKVLPSQSLFGVLNSELIDVSVPIRAVCGDQQASHYAAGDTIGTTKATFGTGTFISQTIGSAFAINEPFFTTLLPHITSPWYGLEAKINDSGARMQAVLNKPEERKALLNELANDVAGYIKKLPLQPKELIIDGGITQAKEFPEILRIATGLEIKQHKISDGTALGVARLLAD